MKYIDADKLIAEIERRKELLENGTGHTEVMKRVEGVLKGYNSILDLITSLQQEQPEYGYVSTEYISGKNPRWKVGDILAYYINNSNEEGECVLGKVVKVEPNEDVGWLYTFENEDVWDEESLITEGTYGK